MAAVERGLLRRRAASGRSPRRSTCCASGRCRRSARCGMGLAVLALQRGPGDAGAVRARHRARRGSSARWAAHAWRKVWGPLLRGKFGDRADDISMAWLWSKLTLRRQLEGDEAREEQLGYPQRSWEPLFDALRARIEARRRARADRPPGGAARARDGLRRRRRGAPGSLPQRPRPARRSRAGEPERYDAVIATRARATSSRRCSTSRGAAAAPPTSRGCAAIEYHTALCLLLELDRQFSPFYWTNIADTRPAVRRADRAHEPDRARALRRPPLPLRRQLPRRRPPAADARRGRAARRATRPACAAVNPAFDRSLGQAARGCTASRPRSRSSTVGYHERIPPLQTRRAAGSCSPTRRRSIPEDRGTNYAVRLGDDAARAMLAEAPR